jgi:predicted ester cyclase
MTQPGKGNVEIVEAAVQAVFSEHRIDQIDRLFTEDLLRHSPLVPASGPDLLRQWVSGTVAAIPDLAYIPSRLLADGDQVLMFATVRGTIHRDLPCTASRRQSRSSRSRRRTSPGSRVTRSSTGRSSRPGRSPGWPWPRGAADRSVALAVALFSGDAPSPPWPSN